MRVCEYILTLTGPVNVPVTLMSHIATNPFEGEIEAVVAVVGANSFGVGIVTRYTRVAVTCSWVTSDPGGKVKMTFGFGEMTSYRMLWLFER